MQSKKAIQIGALFCAISVGIGAFGSHGLKDILAANDRVDTFETGIRYMFISFIGVILSGILNKLSQNKFNTLSGYCLIIGGWIFGMSLISLSVLNITWMGAVAPIGGLAMLSGWVFMALGQKDRY